MILRTIWRTVGVLGYKYSEFLSTVWPKELVFKGGVVGKGGRFHGRPIIKVTPGSKIELGNNVDVYSRLRSNVLACFQPTVLRTIFPEAEIIVGANTGISAAVLCAAVSIQIGENTLLGAGAMVLDNDLHTYVGEYHWDSVAPGMGKPIRIGRGVFVGARAIILKGVTVGDGAVIGAGAVVTRDVPDFHLAFGNPAQNRPLSKDRHLPNVQ